RDFTHTIIDNSDLFSESRNTRLG
uniref:Nephrotoxin PsTX-115 (Fragments) n=1 Tax=Phyllodiscus semoni TaxID=163701 RepID=TX115_PHYSE|nr:RecName: Full=Nephrotoxin PsTX-115 [Phyllodiscus semoni]